MKVVFEYLGWVIVLVFWDMKCEMIVSNELVEIIWMFNLVFDGLEGVRVDFDFYFEEL